MTNQSTINPTQPVVDSLLASAPVRDNFAAAYNDITNIYNLLGSISNGTMAAQNADAVTISGGTINGTAIGNTNPNNGTFVNLTVTNAFTQPDNSIPYSQIQQVSTTALLGNPTAGSANVTEIPLNTTLDMGSGTLGVVDNTSTQKLISAKNGSDVGTRHKINFIEGSNVTLTVADNSGADRVDVTITVPGGGTVNSVAVSGANGIGVSGSPITTSGTIALSLGNITPSQVNGVVISGSSTPTLAVSGTTAVSGSNTGDQTITLTGDVTGSGTGSFATSVAKIAGTTVSGTTGTGNVVFSSAIAGLNSIWGGLTGGLIDALTLTPSPALGSYVTGQHIDFKNNTGTNDSAVTLAVSGLAAAQVRVNNPSGAAPLSGGEMHATETYTVVYDGTYFVLLNPDVGAGVTTTGTPASGNLSKFSGTSSITNGDLSGDITTSGTLATTVAKIQGTAVTGTTGTGHVVLDNTPTLITPNIGAATGSSLSVSGQITSTASTGTAPFVVSSTTQVANLNAATAGSTGSSVINDSSTNATMYPTWVAGTSGAQALEVSSGNYTFNPSTGTLTATTFSGALSGNASTATTATNATNTGITDDATTNATMYPTWVTANTGNLPEKVTSTKFTFNPSTGVLSSTSFTGAGTGLTGTAASLTAGNVTTNANLIGVITSAGNATSIASQTGTGTKFVVDNGPTLIAPLLGTPASGNLANCTFPTLNQNTTGSAASLSISGQSGLMTVSGLASTNRIKTVRDAADTLLELGGSYTPTGTWTSLTMVTPVLGTPTSGVLSNCTGYPGTSALVTTGTLTSGATGAGFTVALGTSTITGILGSANGGTANGFTKFSGPTTTEKTKTLRDATDTILELGGSYTPTGTWTSLTMVTPVLGTPTSGVLTNCTGTAASLTAGNVTTNANMTGDVTSSGSNATTVGAIAGRTVANTAVTVSSNAGTCPVTTLLDTFTNSSAATMAITIATSGATDGQKKIVRIYDFSAAAQTIGWTNTENSTVSAPLTSNGSTTLPLTVGFMYNNATSKWRCVGVA